MSNYPQYKFTTNFQSKHSPKVQTFINQEQQNLRLNPSNSKSIPTFSSHYWKNYIPTELLNEQTSNRFSSPRQINPSYHNQQLDYENRQKSDMMRRVRELQQKVLPMIENDNNYKSKQQEEFGWNNRIEQKLLKLQTTIDSMKKQMEIKMQKRLVQIQNNWENKLEEVLMRIRNNQHPQLK